MATAYDEVFQLADRPGLVAFAGNFAQAAGVERQARAAGCMLHGLIYIDAFDALDPTLGEASLCLVLADAQTDGDRLGTLLETLDRAAACGGPAVIADVPACFIDLAAGCLAAPATMVLVDASPADLVASLAMASHLRSRTASGVADPNSDRKSAELRRLSEDVERIARVLAALSADDGAAAGSSARPAGRPDAEPLGAVAMLRLVRALLRARRLRDRFFPADLFSDPAWDMLLDLMAARIERKPVGVSSLCIAAAVPPTTALRQLKNMTDAGLFVRRPDPVDTRRVFIELAEPTATAMGRYLASLGGVLTAVD